MSESAFTLDSTKLSNHVKSVGATGKGKSTQIQHVANENDISYAEAEKLLQPSPEQVEAQNKIEHEVRMLNESRLLATKKACWDNSDKDGLEFMAFYDALSEVLNISEPTVAQIEKVFMMLPNDVFCFGLQWGFSDTEVRSKIWAFIEKNKAEIQKSFTEE